MIHSDYLVVMEKQTAFLRGGELVVTLWVVARWVELAIHDGTMSVLIDGAPGVEPGDTPPSIVLTSGKLSRRVEALGKELDKRLSRDAARLTRDLARRTTRLEGATDDLPEVIGCVRGLENKVAANARELVRLSARTSADLAALVQSEHKVCELLAADADELRARVDRIDSLLAPTALGNTAGVLDDHQAEADALRLRVESLERIVRGRFPEASHL